MADDPRFLAESHSHDFNKNPNFQFVSCIILHDLSFLCSFVVSYPLYSSYFIFFSPYLIRIISFISPLFIATVLLSLLLTTTTTAFCPKLPQLELEILQSVIHELKSNLDDLNGDGEECDFEIFNFVFDSTPSITMDYEGVDQLEEEGGKLFGDEEERKKLSMEEKVLEDSVHDGRRNDVTSSEFDMDKFEERNSLVKLTSRRPEKNLSMEETVLEDSVHGGRRNDVTSSELVMDKFEEKNSVKLISRRPEKNLSVKETIPEKPVHGGRRNDLTTSDVDNDKLKEENDLVKLFEELDRFEEFPTAIETGTDSDKVIGELRKAEPTPATKFRTGSEAIDSNDNDKITQNSGSDAIKLDKSSSWRSNSSSIHGSMKEEKEWRRTLACKLFEERHNSRGGEEGMDSLWEAYELDNSKNRKDAMIISNSNSNSKNMMMMMNSNNGGIKCFDEDDDDDDDDEDEDMGNGHLCCLQALKLSTGKMNLGMKKPNLLKISKALKGFGWLHHVKIKHGKKS